MGKKIYIIGICGTFTASVAKLAKDLGFEVSGCDVGFYPPMSELLNQLKIRVDVGFELSNIKNQNFDYFIVGNVISRGNPILEHILEYKLPFVSASNWVKENVLKHRKVIAVAGTHGKTTTTTMISHILQENKIDCGYLIAGKPIGYQHNAHLGTDCLFVIEADEYDSAFSEKYPKFMHYHPDILIINNLEFDHADIYKNLSEIQTHFHYLIRTLPKNAQVIVPKNTKTIEQVLNKGFYSKLSYFEKYKNKAKKTANTLYARLKNKKATQIEMCFYDENANERKNILSWDNPQIASTHNTQNAQAALLACYYAGINLQNGIKAIESFKGVSRRMELIFQNEDLKVFDDFAHHPTAIKTTLKSLRNHYPKQKICTIFDPASNTMKNGIYDEKILANAFNSSNCTYFFKPLNTKIDIQKITKLCKNEALYFSEVDLIINSLVNRLGDFDIIMVLTNSGFGNLKEKLIQQIKNK